MPRYDDYERPIREESDKPRLVNDGMAKLIRWSQWANAHCGYASLLPPVDPNDPAAFQERIDLYQSLPEMTDAERDAWYARAKRAYDARTRR